MLIGRALAALALATGCGCLTGGHRASAIPVGDGFIAALHGAALRPAVARSARRLR